VCCVRRYRRPSRADTPRQVVEVRPLDWTASERPGCHLAKREAGVRDLRSFVAPASTKVRTPDLPSEPALTLPLSVGRRPKRKPPVRDCSGDKAGTTPAHCSRLLERRCGCLGEPAVGASPRIAIVPRDRAQLSAYVALRPSTVRASGLLSRRRSNGPSVSLISSW